jgi:3-oxoacyl-[acyl-carrier-protein] synthase II
VYVPAGPERDVLGRKGLLGKDQATRLALCAVHRLFELPPGRPATPVDGAAHTAVVVSSNLGNVAGVCAVVTDVRARSLSAISPLEAPNASSNVIASTLAIWYGCTGPNLMLCNGATSGLDAVSAAARLLRAGRARRAVVVGVEPDDEVARRLAGEDLRAIAVALMLEPPSGGDEVVLDPVVRHEEPDTYADSAPLAFAPHPGAKGTDLTPRYGSGYGALGVLQVAEAATVLAGTGGPATAVVTVGAPEDGYASMLLRRQGR